MGVLFKRKKGVWRWLKNYLYDFIGESRCPGCGDTWTVSGGRIRIEYSNNGGMMPLCRECFGNLDEQMIIFCCKALLRRWRRKGSEMRWNDIKQAIHESILKLKEAA